LYISTALVAKTSPPSWAALSLPVPLSADAEGSLSIKGELNPNNKLGLNDSFSTRINKYNPHTVQFCVV